MADRVEIRQQATAESPEGSSLPLGASQQLEEAFDVPDVDEDEFGEELDEDETDFDIEDDIDLDLGQPSGQDALLFGPSNRPFEPVTAGAPVGPGATGTLRLSDEQLVERFLDEMAGRPDAPEEIKALRNRARLGL